jgi:hypothetical protein
VEQGIVRSLQGTHQSELVPGTACGRNVWLAATVKVLQWARTLILSDVTPVFLTEVAKKLPNQV